MLKRADGATLDDIMGATDWQAHSVRGFISGSLGKKMGLTVESFKRPDGVRAYRIGAVDTRTSRRRRLYTPAAFLFRISSISDSSRAWTFSSRRRHSPDRTYVPLIRVKIRFSNSASSLRTSASSARFCNPTKAPIKPEMRPVAGIRY